MFNITVDHLTVNKILFNKQFGFRAGYSIEYEHALLELNDQICDFLIL